MILPFPTRVSIPYTLLFSSLLVLVQLLEGTDPRYSALCFCFFMLSAFAFNVARGFSRPSGAYIFFYSVLAVEAGTVFKAMIGEPAQSNLENPLLLMSAYVASIAGMLLAAMLSRRIATTQDGIAQVLHIYKLDYYESALGCLVMSVFMTFGVPLLPNAGGQVMHSLETINPFLPLTMFLGTIAAVRDSGGRRSINLINGIAMLWVFGNGLLFFSKQGMFTPAVCWLLGVAWARYRLRGIHFIAIATFVVLAELIMLPIANFGRTDSITGFTDERIAILTGYLTHLPELRHRAETWEAPRDTGMYYYNQPEGLMDRFSMIPNDSLLIEFSNEGHYFGYLALRFYFENWVPHLIEPHKLEGIMVGGNTYMHEMGRMADGDVTTGISFSPTAEAYHIDGWRGVLLLEPAIMLLLFLSCDTVCGDIRRHPLGLQYVLLFAHVAPEGLLGGPIDMVRLANSAYIFGIFFCAYVTPVIGRLLRGQHRSWGNRQLHFDGRSRSQREQLGRS